jgi:phosphate transport system protein
MTHPVIDRPHTVSSYDLQLGEVRSIINRMAELAQHSLAGALDALQSADDVAAEQIVRSDAAIDDLERSLERLALMIIISRAPMAGDLRYLIVSIRIGKMLERTGDQAKRIARRVESFNAVKLAPRFRLVRAMESYASDMIDKAITSFNHASLDLAREVVNADAELNAMNRRLVEACCEAMDARSIKSAEGIQIISIGKQLERVGDYATNIAGDVAYMLTGE